MENTLKPISKADFTLVLIKIWKVSIRSLGLSKPVANAKLQGSAMYVCFLENVTVKMFKDHYSG